LIERAREGDGNAYEILVRRYQELAFRTALLITRDVGEAEDAAQTAFLKAYAALGRFREGAPFRPWLLRIVANEARNRRAAAGRRARHTLTLDGDAGDAIGRLADGGPSPEAALLAAERRSGLLAALNALREEDRAVIAYRYFLDLSEAEMAAALGCAKGTVKSRLSRALGRLRATLTPEASERPDVAPRWEADGG